MRAVLAALFLCACGIFPVRASYLIPQVAPERTDSVAAARHIARADTRYTEKFAPWARIERGALSGILSTACQIARALGGPCGCFASEYFFGRSVRTLWLANAWLAFPHVAPAAGTAAVWPNRHVAAVIAVNGDGTVTVRDSWAVHRVRVAGLVFVDPRVGLPPMRARHARA
jgi:hypothetical protein